MFSISKDLMISFVRTKFYLNFKDYFDVRIVLSSQDTNVHRYYFAADIV